VIRAFVPSTEWGCFRLRQGYGEQDGQDPLLRIARAIDRFIWCVGQLHRGGRRGPPSSLARKNRCSRWPHDAGVASGDPDGSQQSVRQRGGSRCL